MSTAWSPSSSTRTADAPGRHARTTPSCRPRTLWGSALFGSNVGGDAVLRAARGIRVVLPLLQPPDRRLRDPLPLRPVGALVLDLVAGLLQLARGQGGVALRCVRRQQRRHLVDGEVPLQEGGAIARLPRVGQRPQLL